MLVSIIHSFKYGNTGIDYLANFLRQNKNDQIDTRFFHHNESTEIIIDRLPLNYDIYGFSVFETNYYQMLEISQKLKQINSNIIIVFGGQFVTLNYFDMIQERRSVDYYVLGDGESPIKRIIDFHREKTGYLCNDPNIASNIDFSSKRANVESDINRGSDYDYYKYDSFDNNVQKTHCIMTKSNICAGNCSFCCSQKGKVHYKNIDRILNEIKHLAITYGVRKFFLTDDDIFDVDSDENRQRLNKLFDQIIALNFNITFSAFAKAKSIYNPANYELIQKMRKAGFSHIFIGIDAGNEEDMKLYNKSSKLKEGKKALEILKRNEISARYGLIFFNPYTTFERMQENYHFLIDVKSTNYYHYGGLFLQLLSGTRLLKMVRDDGLLKDSFSYLNNSEYYFLNKEIEPYAKFIKNEFLPKADDVKNQFNTLKSVYALVSTVNEKAKKFASYIEEYEQREFFQISNYFGHLYEDGDIDYCRNNIDDYILDMKENSREYKDVILELRDIYRMTPLRKVNDVSDK